MAGNTYLWSTTAATNSASDSDINWAEGQLPSTVNDSARAMMAGVAGLLKDNNSTLTTGGSANAHTVTSNIALTALASGLKLRLKAGFTNTGACTLNLTPAGGGAFGAKAIKIFGSSGESDPPAGAITANGHYIFEYDTAANAAAGAWLLLNPTAAAADIPRGHIGGLVVSNNVADANNDLDIAVGQATDSTGAYLINLTSAMTKRLDANWAVGTNQGGLDTGSASDTIYYVWLIRRPDTGVVDILFSLSATAPSMPANYTQKRRIWSFSRLGAALQPFQQYGNLYLLANGTIDVNITTLSTSRVLLTATAPPNMTILARTFVTNASAYSVWVGPNYETDAAPSASAQPLLTHNGSAGVNSSQTLLIPLDATAQFGARSTTASTTLRIVVTGWFDDRGQFL